MKNLFVIIIAIFCSHYLNASEVKIIDETFGNGLEVTNHSKVSVHYIGRLENNYEFDNSYKRNQTFQFQIDFFYYMLILNKFFQFQSSSGSSPTIKTLLQ